MKRELALQLLRAIIPELSDEGAAANLFRELQFLADYKYNKYEMYYPGRLFLENLYLWLQQFEETERSTALAFVRNELIFISRQEFQQLAGVLYHDKIRKYQIEIAAAMGGYPLHRVRGICESQEFKRVGQASLYVGLSDGARIDYLRRHNLEVSNEQVLPYYETSVTKLNELLRDLRGALVDRQAMFHCLFLLDDFCGSGRTLLREVVVSQLDSGCAPPVIPRVWSSKFRFNQESGELELLYEGELSASSKQALLQMGSGDRYVSALTTLFEKYSTRETILKGALSKIAAGNLVGALDPNAAIFLCPLLATEHAVTRLQPLMERLPGPFAHTRIVSGAILDSRVEITSSSSPMGALCEKYYCDDFGDNHTGSVKFGFDNCGLPLVLHHNSPNNSIYLLWNRKRREFSPLFVRYERHGREAT